MKSSSAIFQRTHLCFMPTVPELPAPRPPRSASAPSSHPHSLMTASFSHLEVL